MILQQPQQQQQHHHHNHQQQRVSWSDSLLRDQVMTAQKKLKVSDSPSSSAESCSSVGREEDLTSNSKKRPISVVSSVSAEGLEASSRSSNQSSDDDSSHDHHQDQQQPQQQQSQPLLKKKKGGPRLKRFKMRLTDATPDD